MPVYVNSHYIMRLKNGHSSATILDVVEFCTIWMFQKYCSRNFTNEDDVKERRHWAYYYIKVNKKSDV